MFEAQSKGPAKGAQKNQKIDFLDWLIHGKGTVSEDWMTPEEVLQNPSVQEDIEAIEQIYKKYHSKNNGSRLV